MIITFLGTSAMVPTKERNHFSFYLKYGCQGMLFDCGEGTQRQLRIAGVRPSKITKIFISHFHGDHILGLPGLFQTLSASQYENTLVIYGPPGLKKLIDCLFELFVFNKQLKIQIVEIQKTRFLDSADYYMEAYPLKHNIFCLGYRFVEKDRRKVNMRKAEELGLKQGPLIGRLQKNISVEHEGRKIKPSEVTYKVKGKIIGFIADTMISDNCYTIAKDSNLLISEATHTSRDKEKAKEFKHFTAKEAAIVARDSHAKKLVLTHFSQRYEDAKPILEDAKEIFDNTVAAEDFMKIKV